MSRCKGCGTKISVRNEDKLCRTCLQGGESAFDIDAIKREVLRE